MCVSNSGMLIKQRFTRLASDCQTTIQVIHGAIPQSPTPGYPHYGVAYNNACSRFNYHQIRMLLRKIRAIKKELRNRPSSRLQRFVSVYTMCLQDIRRDQRKIRDVCRRGYIWFELNWVQNLLFYSLATLHHAVLVTHDHSQTICCQLLTFVQFCIWYHHH